MSKDLEVREPVGLKKLYEILPGFLKTRIEAIVNCGPWREYYQRFQLRHPKSVYQHDTFLVSFPRSGSTWVRFLITNVLWRGNVSHATVDGIIPDIHRRSDRELRSAPFPRVLKSHSPYNIRYPRVIYLVRDGRDVAVSYWHRKRVRGFVYDGFSDFLKRFLDGALGSCGSWQGHVLNWLEGSSRIPFLLVRYEDLKADTLGELGRIVEFLEIPHDQTVLLHAVEASSFSRMRQMEASGKPNMPTSQNGFEIRKGKVGDWRNYFSQPDEDLFWSKAGEAMRATGYFREHVAR